MGERGGGREGRERKGRGLKAGREEGREAGRGGEGREGGRGGEGREGGRGGRQGRAEGREETGQ